MTYYTENPRAPKILRKLSNPNPLLAPQPPCAPLARTPPKARPWHYLHQNGKLLSSLTERRTCKEDRNSKETEAKQKQNNTEQRQKQYRTVIEQYQRQYFLIL
ncbi:hypothetical protein V6Z12_A10G156100 [Gossypium hirsutum]